MSGEELAPNPHPHRRPSPSPHLQVDVVVVCGEELLREDVLHTVDAVVEDRRQKAHLVTVEP